MSKKVRVKSSPDDTCEMGPIQVTQHIFIAKNRKREAREKKKTIFSLSIWTNMANKALFECGIWSKTLHALGFIDEDESTSEPNHFGTHKHLKDFSGIKL